MKFADSEAMAAFRTEVREFLATEVPDYIRLHPDISQGAGVTGGPRDDEEIRPALEEWRRRIVAKNWIAPAWAPEFGGAGLSILEQFVMNEEFAIARVPHPGGFGVMIAGPTIITHGSEEQQQRFLPPILSGETRWAQGWSEPAAGSDVASVQTRAVRDGDEYVVNGQKIWTTGAHYANMMYMLARTDPDAPKHRGISYLIFPLDSPGVTIRPLEQMNGVAEFNEVFFEDVRVPVANRLGEENRGWYVGVTTLDFERSGIGLAVGMRQSIDRLAAFAKECGALAQRPTLRLELADRTIEAETAMQLSYRVVTMQAAGLIPNHEASAAKLYSSELSQRIAGTGMAIGGLFGQILDPATTYGRARAGSLGDRYLSSVSATIAGGTSEIQRNIIAGRGLGMPRA